MEFLLLWADEIDDALGVLKHLAPRILGLAAASASFAATGYALTVTPQPALAAIALGLAAILIERVRRRSVQRSSATA